MRSLAIDIACRYGDADCQNTARTKFSAWRSSPEDLTMYVNITIKLHVLIKANQKIWSCSLCLRNKILGLYDDV